MLMHRRASRALALGSAVAALAVPATAVASPIDAQPQRSDAAIVDVPASEFPKDEANQLAAKPLPSPTAQVPADEDGSVAWSTIVLALAGAGLVAGVALVTRRSRRPRATA